MGEAIGPGDLVECIDASMRHHNTVKPPFIEGAVYTVREVGVNSNGVPGINLVGVKDAKFLGRRGYYFLDRFRPLRGRFDYLLRDIPADLETERTPEPVTPA